MSLYTIKLIKKIPKVTGVVSFHFEKPDGFTYIAGQYGDFTLINPPETDSEGNKRTFSFASAPYESDLVITTRLRDTAFKRVLKHLPVGSEVMLEGPFGSLALPKDTSKTAVFLTGGVGATLVKSMVTQATHDQSPHEIIFLYSNHAPKDTIFLSEFTSLASQNKNFLFVPTMTRPTKEWEGERGAIETAMLKKYVKDIIGSIYYLSGPGPMIGDMRRMLLATGVDRTNIRADQFVGY